MNRFEEQLRAALRRQDPPPGFADRVLERTATPAVRVMPARWQRVLWASGAIAAALAVVWVSASTYQHSKEEKVARQAELALRIAAEKLNLARAQVLKNTTPKDY